MTEDAPPVIHMFNEKIEACRYRTPSEEEVTQRPFPASFGEGYVLPEHRDKFLATINKVPFFDDNIVFYEEPHLYTFYGQVTSASVSGVLKPYLKPFDANETIERMKKKFWPRHKYSVGCEEVSCDNPVSNDDLVIVLDTDSGETTFSGEYYKVVQLRPSEKLFTYERAMTNEEISEMWDSPLARNMGTEGHLMFENFFNGEPVYHTPEVKAGMNFVEDQMFKLGAKGWRCEWEIYGWQEDIAGSIDSVAYSKTNNAFYILDWKRAKKLENFKAYNNIKEFTHIPEHDIGKYTFQISIYKYIIEKYTDMKIEGLALVSILQDTNFWCWCPYLKYETEFLMRKYRQAVAKRLLLRHARPDLPVCSHSNQVAYDASRDSEGKVWNDRVHKIHGGNSAPAKPDHSIRKEVRMNLSAITSVNVSREEKNLAYVRKFKDMVQDGGVRDFKNCDLF